MITTSQNQNEKTLALTFYLPIVPNAVSSQYKSTAAKIIPQSAISPIFLQLGIPRCMLGPCDTCLGHVTGARGMEYARYLAC